jgi:hypothetical protein
MARTRNIKPGFFKNEDVASCDPVARLLFAGLWTLADADGRMEYRPLRIKAELFPYDSFDIVPMFGQLVARGLVVIYRVGTGAFLEIPRFRLHQRCHPSEASEGFPSCEDGPAVNFHGEQLFPVSNCALPSFPSLSSFPSSNPSASSALSTPQPRRRSKPADPLRWSAGNGWEGITDADHAEWSKAYPAADLPVELAKAHQWLKANPKKATKSSWRRWITTTWFSRCQDRGGTHREPGIRPGGSPPVVRIPRPEFDGRPMTDEEFSRAKRHAAQQAALRADRENARKERQEGPKPLSEALAKRYV